MSAKPLVHLIKTDEDEKEDDVDIASRYQWTLREPSLLPSKEPKKSIKELAAMCGLPYRDGKVG